MSEVTDKRNQEKEQLKSDATNPPLTPNLNSNFARVETPACHFFFGCAAGFRAFIDSEGQIIELPPAEGSLAAKEQAAKEQASNALADKKPVAKEEEQ